MDTERYKMNDKVRITNATPGSRLLAGQTGVIVGQWNNGVIPFDYGVRIDEDHNVYCVYEDEIERYYTPFNR